MKRDVGIFKRFANNCAAQYQFSRIDWDSSIKVSPQLRTLKLMIFISQRKSRCKEKHCGATYLVGVTILRPWFKSVKEGIFSYNLFDTTYKIKVLLCVRSYRPGQKYKIVNNDGDIIEQSKTKVTLSNLSNDHFMTEQLFWFRTGTQRNIIYQLQLTIMSDFHVHVINCQLLSFKVNYLGSFSNIILMIEEQL